MYNYIHYVNESNVYVTPKQFNNIVFKLITCYLSAKVSLFLTKADVYGKIKPLSCLYRPLRGRFGVCVFLKMKKMALFASPGFVVHITLDFH